MAEKKYLVALFLISLLCCSFPGFAQAADLSSEVPVPGGSILVDRQDLTYAGREVRTLGYESRQKIGPLVDYFKKTLSEREFQCVLDQDQRGEKHFKFHKDDLMVTVTIWQKAPGTNYILIGKYRQAPGEPDIEDVPPSFKDSIFALPKEDAPGTTDLKVVPRPPKSVRWTSFSMSGTTLLVYSSPQSIAELAGFYRTKMPFLGWKLDKEFSADKVIRDYKQALGKESLGIELPIQGGENIEEIMSGAYVLDFLQGNRARARVTIFPNFVNKKQGNIVHINYYENQG